MRLCERIEGGRVGLLVGDARALPPRAQLGLVPPPGFARSHAAVAPGTWSDDGAQALYFVMAAGSYESVVRAAVALGDDTDTTAAIAGGVAGLRDGLTAIPARWREALRGRELLDPILDGLRARAG